MKGLYTLLIGLLGVARMAPAQDITRPDSTAPTAATAQVTIQADVDSAVVFIDSVMTGQTPLVVKGLQPGWHRLKIVHPDVTNWLTGSILDSIQLIAGEEKAVRYAFGKRYLILSVPSGADVMVGDSLHGTTPLVLTLQETGSNPSITLRKAGYDSARVDLSETQKGTKTVALKRLWSPDQRGEDVEEMTAERGGSFRAYLAGAVTVGFGAAAAYFKIQADHKNDRYLQDLSSASHSQIQVYDTASAICLAFAEVGFGFLTYYLLSD